MTKEQLIAEYKAQYPTLTYGVNDEIFEMNVEQYEQTIVSWAEARIAKAEAKAQTESLRATKIAAYQKLGLSEAEIEALLPTPKPLIPKE